MQIPANQLVGRLVFGKSALNVADIAVGFDKKDISDILNHSLVTITLVDNFRSVQDVLPTKLPPSLFNAISSLCEGAVVHSVECNFVDGALLGEMEVMFKIPIAFTGSLDLDSNKYLRVDLELAFAPVYVLQKTEVFARQTSTFTNDAIRYKRLNVPDGVQTYEFVPEGCAYIVNGQANGKDTANVDFVELTYNTGITAHVDFYELLSKYYEENEISARVISRSSSKDLEGEMFFESTILCLDTIGVANIRIVRNNTSDDTTIVVMDKLVTSASENNSSAGDVVKLASGQYVAANEKVVATEELKQLMTPQKPYAAAITINKMASEAVSVKPAVAVGTPVVARQSLVSSMLADINGLVAKMK